MAAHSITRTGLYARISTANNGQSPEMQLRELREYCERRGWTVAGEYVDVGVSGTKERRVELDRLMQDAHRRCFDAVIVWKFDRFARSVSHLLRALETFQALGIHFVSLSESLDTSTPAGKMVFTVLGAVAELERSLIVERVKAGLRNARSKGKRLGRPRKVLDAARIAALRAQGVGWKRIAAELGVGVGTIHQSARMHPGVDAAGIPPVLLLLTRASSASSARSRRSWKNSLPWPMNSPMSVRTWQPPLFECASSFSRPKIARQLGVSVGTAYQAARP